MLQLPIEPSTILGNKKMKRSNLQRAELEEIIDLHSGDTRSKIHTAIEKDNDDRLGILIPGYTSSND